MKTRRMNGKTDTDTSHETTAAELQKAADAAQAVLALTSFEGKEFRIDGMSVTTNAEIDSERWSRVVFTFWVHPE